MNKKFKKNFILLCIFCFIIAMGLFFGLNSWNKNLYVKWSPSQGRGIAGVNSSTKILNFSSKQLMQKVNSTLFSQGQVIEEGDLMAFYLGNFLVQDSHSGKHRFICEIFPLVEFSFSAMGINLSGEEGLMLIQSPCNMEDEDFIGPFWIPNKEILAEPSKNSFELPEEESFIRFYNASILLTPSWLLKNVRFFSEAEQDDEFLVRFVPGSENPYFELSLKNTEPPKETAL